MDRVHAVEAVRRFSRFYTKRIGLLEEGFLHSDFTLPEGRVIYELAHLGEASSGDLAEALGLDAGYISRLVSGLESRGIVERRRGAEDRRRVLLSLSPEGQGVFQRLSAASSKEIDELLSPLSPADRAGVVRAMTTIEEALTPGSKVEAPVVLRGHRPGDIGWVIQRHGELYHDLRGWDVTFDALVADIAARFVENFDPSKERCWIAERAGERIGSVFLTKKSETVGQLRMLIVEPSARGLGVGRRLVGECVSHARFVGYEKMILFTSAGLESARKIYEAEGFRLVEEKPQHIWGKDHVEQWWELDL